jgi:hypothetical protein
MLPKAIDQVVFADLERLRSDAVPEGRTLEYKSEMPSSADSSRIPFLSGVCALANTRGGDVVFGITEKRGIPTELPGVVVDDEDATLLQLEQVMRTGLEPRVVQPMMKFVTAPDGRKFLIVRVPQSWDAPHRVTYKDHSRFYRRNSAGKYSMDVAELRAAFLQSQGPAAGVRALRAERVPRIKDGVDPPVNIDRGMGFLVLHLIPLVSLDGVGRIDIATARKDPSLVAPIGGESGWRRKVNMDGVVTYSESASRINAYTQVFRSGGIEAVSTFHEHEGQVVIPSVAYERDVIAALRRYLRFLRDCEVPPPIAVFLSLLGVRTHRFGVSFRQFGHQGAEPLDRDDILAPEVICETHEEDPATLLRPAFDVVWQSFGFERSFNYAEDGTWTGER